jgi:hypothetical protein
MGFRPVSLGSGRSRVRPRRCQNGRASKEDAAWVSDCISGQAWANRPPMKTVSDASALSVSSQTRYGNRLRLMRSGRPAHSAMPRPSGWRYSNAVVPARTSTRTQPHSDVSADSRADLPGQRSSRRDGGAPSPERRLSLAGHDSPTDDRAKLSADDLAGERVSMLGFVHFVVRHAEHILFVPATRCGICDRIDPCPRHRDVRRALGVHGCGQHSNRRGFPKAYCAGGRQRRSGPCRRRTELGRSVRGGLHRTDQVARRLRATGTGNCSRTWNPRRTDSRRECHLAHGTGGARIASPLFIPPSRASPTGTGFAQRPRGAHSGTCASAIACTGNRPRGVSRGRLTTAGERGPGGVAADARGRGFQTIASRKGLWIGLILLVAAAATALLINVFDREREQPQKRPSLPSATPPAQDSSGIGRVDSPKTTRPADDPASREERPSNAEGKNLGLAQYRIDVFWCTPSGARATTQAAAIVKTLDSTFQLMRVRTRKLEFRPNGPWASGYEIRVDPDGSEDTAGKLLQQHLRVQFPNRPFGGWASPQATPLYLSVFVCPGTQSTEELDRREPRFSP